MDKSLGIYCVGVEIILLPEVSLGVFLVDVIINLTNLSVVKIYGVGLLGFLEYTIVKCETFN